MPSFIIVEDASQILGSGAFWPPSIQEQPRKSNKVVSNERITLFEQDDFVENKKNYSCSHQFFSNIITNLGILQYIEGESVSQNMDDQLMKVIIKYWLHPSIISEK